MEMDELPRQGVLHEELQGSGFAKLLEHRSSYYTGSGDVSVCLSARVDCLSLLEARTDPPTPRPCLAYLQQQRMKLNISQIPLRSLPSV